MDGKKRIARLRNAEKWKKLGFNGLGLFRNYKKDPKVKVEAQPVGIGIGELQLMVFGGKKKRNKDAPRTDGKVWDFWRCQWVDPPKPGRFGTAQAMIDALVKKGYKQLGSGHYSTVLGHPKSPDKVIKVTRHQDNWIDYVKWAAENGYAGTFGPKVYSWKKFPAGWSWAVVERMSHCVGEGYYDDDYCGCSDSSCCPRETRGKSDDYEIIFTLLNSAQRGNLMAQVYVDDLCPGAFEYISKLKSAMRAGDIRAANTMVRKDGTLCFTDPCAGASKLTSTRFKERDFVPSVWRYYEILQLTLRQRLA